jgi:hypothetical protein
MPVLDYIVSDIVSLRMEVYLGEGERGLVQRPFKRTLNTDRLSGPAPRRVTCGPYNSVFKDFVVRHYDLYH